jgi:hypothetical protein
MQKDKETKKSNNKLEKTHSKPDGSSTDPDQRPGFLFDVFI